MAETRIDGNDLRPNKTYEYEGDITITGDVPAGAKITINNGSLTIEGSISSGAKVKFNAFETQ